MPSTPWRRSRWLAILPALALATLLLHGYHPLAEDGGLYVAGVEFTLNPALFPHDTAFVREHLGFSAFAPMLAALVHLTRLPLPWLLLLVDLAALTLTFQAAHALLRRCLSSEPAQLAGLALLTIWATLPIAGTSLLLVDPYVTARSLSTPLSLFALAFALDDWRPVPRSALLCAGSLILAALFHPLMAADALAVVLCIRATRLRRPRLAFALLTLAALALAMFLTLLAPPESPSFVAAAITRYYWFLSQWHWYELLGLAGPLLVLAALLRWPVGHELATDSTTHNRNYTDIAHAAIAVGLLATSVTLLFAHESAPTHVVARLQPLRVFLLVYAIMTLLLGACLGQALLSARRRSHSRVSRRYLAGIPAAALLGLAAVMFLVQRQTFPASDHLEFPWLADRLLNPWSRAFLWARSHTPCDALFALDAHYITTPGEDAQTFRATAQRSALPDFSKDGGEASIAPSLAPLWQQGVAAQLNLSGTPDAVRDARLRPLGVTWLVLSSATITSHPCPYNNGVVKLCLLHP